MMQLAAHREIAKALLLLFGEEKGGLPPRVDASGLKRVYLAQIFQHHPDRNSQTTFGTLQSNGRAVALNDAYALLRKEMKFGGLDTRRYFKGPKTRATNLSDGLEMATTVLRYPPRAKGPRPCHRGLSVEDFQTRWQTDQFWTGPLPSRKLRFGQYLYYRGVISWGSLMSALAWQNSQRPPFGQVALGLGFLSEVQLKSIVAVQLPGELLGDCATRCMGLTSNQRRLVAEKQKVLLKPLGDYFVQSGTIGPLQLAHYLLEHCRHNSGIPS